MYNNNNDQTKVTLTPELYNLLTLPYADNLQEITPYHMFALIQAAAESVGL